MEMFIASLLGNLLCGKVDAILGGHMVIPVFAAITVFIITACTRFAVIVTANSNNFPMSISCHTKTCHTKTLPACIVLVLVPVDFLGETDLFFSVMPFSLRRLYLE